ncbi:MAG: hypothetical protein V7641_2183 [Blastocatellia bacterium]
MATYRKCKDCGSDVNDRNYARHIKEKCSVRRTNKQRKTKLRNTLRQSKLNNTVRCEYCGYIVLVERFNYYLNTLCSVFPKTRDDTILCKICGKTIKAKAVQAHHAVCETEEEGKQPAFGLTQRQNQPAKKPRCEKCGNLVSAISYNKHIESGCLFTCVCGRIMKARNLKGHQQKCIEYLTVMAARYRRRHAFFNDDSPETNFITSSEARGESKHWATPKRRRK